MITWIFPWAYEQNPAIMELGAAGMFRSCRATAKDHFLMIITQRACREVAGTWDKVC